MVDAGVTPTSMATNANVASGEASSSPQVKEDRTHIVYQHFRVPLVSSARGKQYVCKFCTHKFSGSVGRLAQHLTNWMGGSRREVKLCTAVTKEVAEEVRAHYEARLQEAEDIRSAEAASIEAVSGHKRSRITDFFGDEKADAKKAADEAICLMFAGLRLPEYLADHPLWRCGVHRPRRKWLCPP
ncbi:hypothetical protein CLOP_g12325 [Closterium sp. NIES-67]|nr:hypothetical protein CLOP_g12325 [Closterium sp. NIES-67]